MELMPYLAEKSKEMILGCRKEAHDGTTLYTPDGVGNYDALWPRDFCYMCEYAGEFIPDEDVKKAIEYLLRGQNPDGQMPDRVYADGRVLYAAGDAPPNACGLPNLDNGSFLVILADLYCQRDADHDFSLWEDRLVHGMDTLPLTLEGLVYNDPVTIHSPYGFTDTVGKSGRLFFESLLVWRAAYILAGRCKKEENIRRFAVLRDKIEDSIFLLWSEEEGGFLSADRDCAQYDVWGNAYAVYIGFPLGEKRDIIINTLMRDYSNCVWRGQVRHLRRGEYWQRLLFPHVARPEEYQNGAYWGCASGWYAWAIAQKDAALAEKLIADCAADFAENGIYECVNEGGYAKLDTYVVSVTNVYGAYKRMKGQK